ncbi:MAG: hypothetical protein ABSC23_03850 [Bryobacteraceae bacterium]|jgi:hypothetical protein
MLKPTKKSEPAVVTQPKPQIPSMLGRSSAPCSTRRAAAILEQEINWERIKDGMARKVAA